MGCDIHLITQIKRNNKWEYVEDIPEEYDYRNYFNFSILADVRNDFGTKGFQPKGLPEDLGGKKFGWESNFEYIKNCYETNTSTRCKLPNGNYISDWDDALKRYCTKEEYEEFKGSKGCCQGEHYVYDPNVVGGELVKVPYKELYTFEEYLKEYYSEEYDEELNDYGRWRVDFNDCVEYGDLHTPSYLTLKELVEKDYDDIFYQKVKVSEVFIKAFLSFGGELPKEMKIDNDWQPSDIRDCLRQAIDPVCIVKWKDTRKEKNINFFKGIEQLKEIANKYNITNYDDIRIVFAFDN